MIIKACVPGGKYKSVNVYWVKHEPGYVILVLIVEVSNKGSDENLARAFVFSKTTW